MPNIKIYLDDSTLDALRDRLTTTLPDLRSGLCSALGVDIAAAQVAVLPVLGLPDQPAINVEIHALAAPTRTPEVLRGVAQMVRDLMMAATQTRTAVRITTLDPSGYVTLK